MSEDQPLVIIIDDDPDIRDALKHLLETVDLPTALFATASEYLASKRQQGPCCIVADVRLPASAGSTSSKSWHGKTIQYLSFSSPVTAISRCRCGQ